MRFCGKVLGWGLKVHASSFRGTPLKLREAEEGRWEFVVCATLAALGSEAHLGSCSGCLQGLSVSVTDLDKGTVGVWVVAD